MPIITFSPVANFGDHPLHVGKKMDFENLNSPTSIFTTKVVPDLHGFT